MLSERQVRKQGARREKVLILVLMENALRENLQARRRLCIHVLILVLMENALREYLRMQFYANTKVS